MILGHTEYVFHLTRVNAGLISDIGGPFYKFVLF